MRTFLKNADWIAFLVLAVIFVSMPQIDLVVSSWFYDHENKLWPYEEQWLASIVYVFLRYIPYVLIPVLLIWVSWSIYKFGIKSLKSRVSLFLLLSLLIGPGLVVHNIFKEVFERSRPRQVQEFDGKATFTPAFVISDSCQKSCKSFISGHAAMGFWVMAFAWVYRKRSWLYAGIMCGVIASAGRIVQGGHFLSDTIFAGFVCYFIYRALSWWLLGHSRINEEPNAKS